MPTKLAAVRLYETGCSAAVRNFKSLFPGLNKSTVRGFQKKYLPQMKLTEKRSRSPEKSIVKLQRGRPLPLGNDIDENMRKYIMTFRYNGGQATFSIAIAVAKALIKQCDNKSLKILRFGKDWAQSLFRGMSFKKRAVTTGEVIISEGAQKEAKLIYLYDIVTKNETYNIPHQLDLDQTPLKYIQSSRYTVEKCTSISVAIAVSEEKRAITAMFIIDLAGNFLLMQLIYGGKTDRSLPKVDLPKGFSLSANPKHYSNEKKTQN